MKKAFAVLLLLLVISYIVQAKGWKGITPLHSTCEDVKRALGVDSCTLPMSNYTLPDFRVVVFFSKNRDCDADARDWRVPAGTVTSLVVSPRNEMLPSELGIDVSKFKSLGQGDVVGTEGYDNRDEGVEIHLFKGFIQYVVFYPPSNKEKLRCKPMKSP